jgi:hypothetical protein
MISRAEVDKLLSVRRRAAVGVAVAGRSGRGCVGVKSGRGRRQLMAKEVHVTASQADAARMILERDSAHRKPTPEAIRKIAMAWMRPSPEPTNRPEPRATVNGRKKERLRLLLTRAFGKGCSWGR